MENFEEFFDTFTNQSTKKTYKSNINRILKFISFEEIINHNEKDIIQKCKDNTNSKNTLKSFIKTISSYYSFINIDHNIFIEFMKNIESKIQNENSKKIYSFINTLKSLKTKLKKIDNIELKMIYSLYINYPPLRGQDFLNINKSCYKNGVITLILNKTGDTKTIKLNKNDKILYDNFFNENYNFKTSYKNFIDNTIKYFDEKLTANSFRDIYIKENFDKINNDNSLSELQRENKLKIVAKNMNSSIEALRGYYLQI